MRFYIIGNTVKEILMNQLNIVANGSEFAFNNKHMILHMDLPEICNQHCSYCIIGNNFPEKPRSKLWTKEQFNEVLDKIFKTYDKDTCLGFVWAGGEPTLHPYFEEAVQKVKDRGNTYQILTTNLSKPVEYYKKLDIPIVVSLHLEFLTPKDCLEKILQLQDLTAFVRIMAFKEKFEEAKQAYLLFEEASKNNNISFKVFEIFAYDYELNNYRIHYDPEYTKEQIEYLNNNKPIIKYSAALKEKLGILDGAFFGDLWKAADCKGKTHALNVKQYYDNFKCNDDECGRIVEAREAFRTYKGWYCQMTVNRILADGTLSIAWCEFATQKYNLFKQDYPKMLPRICPHDLCMPLVNRFICAIVPKYKSIKYAPKYQAKSALILLKTKTFALLSLLKIKRFIRKIPTVFIFSRNKRKQYRDKYVKPLK
jgi:sulfatase maturation enzyme AslB (radical SAM superfamily)